MTGARLETIRARLDAAFSPTALTIRDDSARHAGHPGARGGAGHYAIKIEADAFRGLRSIARHRLVYDALADMLPDEIHALSIDATAPGER